MGIGEHMQSQKWKKCSPKFSRLQIMHRSMPNHKADHYEDSGKKIALSSGQGYDKGKIREKLQSQGSNAKHHATEPEDQPLLKPTNDVVHDDEHMPLSGNPYFHCIITKSNIKSLFQLVIPAKLHSLLPSVIVPVVLSFQNKCWKMKYYGDRNLKRFDPSWRNFAVDNDLKVGDACVFDLMTNTREFIKFRVQILRGDIPNEFLRSVSGESLEMPISLD
ncbi:B3 domain-containing protein Os04g0386900-like isoform X2 [Macadamia integrifolia]|uniref:B3 domain-containing protein Os04g0386900-like isoform X2 n=1 Tax=Macadamia integrifolia TaxID=60698 RepID=UPI001C4FED3F|nr:B3 domain-containing protein Os04g0386900-like isoform X2 [Macadamia integrifolia]